ncbi:putative 28.5 kDa protein in 7S RNA 5'region [Pseudocercospora fuligena]|uniref:Putative 28.5 kDa protein in 7S RNA 5'region n=1 Tax=Pseudocercospora fuligena TaxID=685502 RepID=A0A8H6VQR2_9PEZI|nr:putative 28.5 kDa protein in 7S RNA 5'region [Pseudocercospora fuligena]
MGLGIAKLLLSHDFNVITNASGRSLETQERARKNGISLVDTDSALFDAADVVLSIVPPRDSLTVAKRISTASGSASKSRPNPLCFMDLNAVSPRTAREVSDLLSSSSSNVKYIDGGIIGAPPSLKEDGSWYRPSIPVSGPYKLSQAHPSGDKLAEVLNIRHVNDTIGAATGLKMCFASLSKGFTALAIESFTTAHSLGVLDELRQHLDDFSPGVWTRAEKGLISMPPKAYRWVNEMEEIASTFEADGGFHKDESPFRAIANIYKLVADGTDLGLERTEDRKRGKSVDDVAKLVLEGTAKRKTKTD